MDKSSVESSQPFRNHPSSRLYGRSHGLKQSYLPDDNVFGANKPFLAEDTVTKIVQRALAGPAEGKAALCQHQPGRELPAVDVERSAPDVGSGGGFGIDNIGQARPSRAQPWSATGSPETTQSEGHVSLKQTPIWLHGGPRKRSTTSSWGQTPEDCSTSSHQETYQTQVHDSPRISAQDTSTTRSIAPPHPHGRPKFQGSPMRPGHTHREPFDLDFEKVYFGKLIHIDRIEGEPWTDRPAIVTGVNEDSRRVRFFTVYSFGEAGGLMKRFNNIRYQQEAEKEHNMRNFILIENEQLAARPHLGTPVVRLKGEQLTKSCWVNTAEVRELPFDRVCAQSIGHTLNEAWLPLDQMRILRVHVHRQGNSLFPSEKDGRLERYDGGWCGYREYEKEGLGRTRN